jgi:hypothetical protein
MAKKGSVLEYQQRCFREYGKSISLPDPYTYPDGNPIRPLPPVNIAAGGLMIVGAYPSARFEKRRSREKPNRYRLIPVADNLQPFGAEQYFDGIQVRTLTSADGLEEYLLKPLKISIETCWVTDLVKVFLYKRTHVDSCGAVAPDFEVHQRRTQFKKLGKASLPWLIEKCSLCEPKLIVTLGQEVAQVVSGRWSGSADEILKPRIVQAPGLGNYPTMYLPHLMHVGDMRNGVNDWRNV